MNGFLPAPRASIRCEAQVGGMSHRLVIKGKLGAMSVRAWGSTIFLKKIILNFNEKNINLSTFGWHD